MPAEQLPDELMKSLLPPAEYEAWEKRQRDSREFWRTVFNKPDPIRERIVEVLRKYNVTLADAPLDALTMAMERMIENRSQGNEQ